LSDNLHLHLLTATVLHIFERSKWSEEWKLLCHFSTKCIDDAKKMLRRYVKCISGRVGTKDSTGREEFERKVPRFVQQQKRICRRRGSTTKVQLGTHASLFDFFETFRCDSFTPPIALVWYSSVGH